LFFVLPKMSPVSKPNPKRIDAGRVVWNVGVNGSIGGGDNSPDKSFFLGSAVAADVNQERPSQIIAKVGSGGVCLGFSRGNVYGALFPPSTARLSDNSRKFLRTPDDVPANFSPANGVFLPLLLISLER
ncbi:hypothetical protein KI387_025823, partial [Taxus chinensis]